MFIMKKRISGLILALVLLVSSFPVSAVHTHNFIYLDYDSTTTSSSHYFIEDLGGGNTVPAICYTQTTTWWRLLECTICGSTKREEGTYTTHSNPKCPSY